MENKVSRKKTLGGPKPYLDLPKQGVYFFFSIDETRASTKQLRVTRIGTHAILEGSKTSLWNRLSTHRGTLAGSYPGGGNHRRSKFRELIGASMIECNKLSKDFPNWNNRQIDRHKIHKIKKEEYELEKLVSEYIRKLPFLWVGIDDELNHRKNIERNSIALISNFNKTAIDPRSSEWLGKYYPKVKIKNSGLWNFDYVDKEYDHSFLDLLAKYIDDM